MKNYDLGQAFWDESKNLCLFSYYPKNSFQKNQYTELVWQFKSEKTSAIRTVTQMAVQALAQNESKLRIKQPYWYLVTMPPHEAGQHNRSCEILCARLAMYYPWLRPLPNVLRRTADTVQSSMAKHRGTKRATYLDHALSISYEGPKEIDAHDHGILLVDDVSTTGNTFQACYGILNDATRCKPIIGFFIGKTVW